MSPRPAPSPQSRVSEVYPAGADLQVRVLGTVPYADGLRLQEDLVIRRRNAEIPDQLLLLEHPHVITLGSSTNRAHLRADETTRRALGIEVFETGRGGDVTYHGPGQLVGYSILDLKPDRKDLHRYLRDLEEVLIQTLADFQIQAERKHGFTGVWVNDRKIAAIGVRVSSAWITSHGFALNVSTDLTYFDTIVPCGLHDRGVTSIAHELAWTPPLRVVGEPLIAHFARVFARHVCVV